MSKELTEKWKNGTLDIGWYFIRIKDGRCVKDYFKKDFEVFFDTYIEEVLAKVPTYDKFSQLLKKIEELEKLLKECKGVIDECVRSDYIEELKERIDEVLK